MLRDYQKNALEQLSQALKKDPACNPILVMPTGSGKSHIIAAICERVHMRNPRARILILAHVKELLLQNYEKILLHYPMADIGLYSAGLNKRENDKAIVVAGIQSIQQDPSKMGDFDLILIDECHLVNNELTGGYRKTIQYYSKKKAISIIGFTATPYRLGQGALTSGPDAIFKTIIDPISIESLVENGYLVPLSSKAPTSFDLSGLKLRGGEFIDEELQKVVDSQENNAIACDRIIDIGLSQGRKCWLIFCVGVAHAEKIYNLMTQKGIASGLILGETEKAIRTKLINKAKEGQLRCLINANVLTTGFDAPIIDMIVLLRPTMSTGLYVQSLGRGMRPNPGKQNCLVLDFVGNVCRHGPIDAINYNKQCVKKEGEAPVKLCPDCNEIVHLARKTCTSCGHVFTAKENEKFTLVLRDDPIMKSDEHTFLVSHWVSFAAKSRKTGLWMVCLNYYDSTTAINPKLVEYILCNHRGFAYEKAMELLHELFLEGGGGEESYYMELEDGQDTDTPMSYAERLAEIITMRLSPPKMVVYTKVGKYRKIVRRIWQ